MHCLFYNLHVLFTFYARVFALTSRNVTGIVCLVENLQRPLSQGDRRQARGRDGQVRGDSGARNHRRRFASHQCRDFNVAVVVSLPYIAISNLL